MVPYLYGIGFLILTVFFYFISKKLYSIIPSPFTLPIIITSLSIIIFLYLFDIPYSVYMYGGQWINHFLGPLVVALALPLYRQRYLIKKYALVIFTGILTGSFIGVLSGVLLTLSLGFGESVIAAVAPKSVTTPVALSITDATGGSMSLAAIFVMIAGISGAMFAPMMWRAGRVNHPVAKGLGIGTASHAIGTAKALEDSELAGAVSALSMTISAVLVSLIAPLVLKILF
ncbi:TIGR00659 family protein [Gracilibacillus ureilyticus]|uniref:TIGR00659 family protein n=1 Tax=Gracilibacillus ureilyticus TaxID=531814 RepID=A0A1H9QCU4_9BACI|nr:LrgB family protein [Gracilibacillus ureilyticus]SER58294.1 TIGR00659 family protein [Gracilibacillus ureilyticus]